MCNEFRLVTVRLIFYIYILKIFIIYSNIFPLSISLVVCSSLAYFNFIYTWPFTTWHPCLMAVMAAFSRITPCHGAHFLSDWFLEHDDEHTVLKWPPQTPDLKPLGCGKTGHCIVDVQSTNMQKPCDAITSIWIKISEGRFNQLVESTHGRQKRVQPSASQVYLIKWPTSIDRHAHLLTCSWVV